MDSFYELTYSIRDMMVRSGQFVTKDIEKTTIEYFLQMVESPCKNAWRIIKNYNNLPRKFLFKEIVFIYDVLLSILDTFAKFTETDKMDKSSVKRLTEILNLTNRIYNHITELKRKEETNPNYLYLTIEYINGFLDIGLTWQFFFLAFIFYFFTILQTTRQF